jgi:Dolichyl-phosphate-mannose-protein mannosyltransferase
MSRLISILRSYSTFLLVTLITVLAAFLRFYKLGAWSFWGDEVFTLGSKPDGFIQSLSTSLIHATTGVLGVNEWNARLIPALVGIITIPIFYFIVSRLFGSSVGLISSALLAVSTWHIYWSQTARFYALLLLFYSVALFSFYLALERNRPWLLLFSLILLGFAAQERMLALVLIPVVVSYLIVLLILRFEKPAGLNFKNLAIYFTPGLVVAIFIAGPFAGNLNAWITGFGRINNTPLWLFSGFIYYVGFPIACMASFGAIFLLRKKDRAGLFFGLAAIVPLFVIMVVSTFQFSANRYFFISLTSWITLASLATYELMRQQKGEARLLAIGVLVLLLGTSLSEDYLYYRYQNGNRGDYRSAFEFIQERQNQGDLVFSGEPDVGDYYLGQQTFYIGNFEEEALKREHRRAWFVTDMNTAELFPQQLAWIEENARQVANFDVPVRGRTFKMRVYLYDPAWETNQGGPSDYPGRRPLN